MYLCMYVCACVSDVRLIVYQMDIYTTVLQLCSVFFLLNHLNSTDSHYITSPKIMTNM